MKNLGEKKDIKPTSCTYTPRAPKSMVRKKKKILGIFCELSSSVTPVISPPPVTASALSPLARAALIAWLLFPVLLQSTSVSLMTFPHFLEVKCFGIGPEQPRVLQSHGLSHTSFSCVNPLLG